MRTAQAVVTALFAAAPPAAQDWAKAREEAWSRRKELLGKR